MFVLTQLPEDASPGKTSDGKKSYTPSWLTSGNTYAQSEFACLSNSGYISAVRRTYCSVASSDMCPRYLERIGSEQYRFSP